MRRRLHRSGCRLLALILLLLPLGPAVGAAAEPCAMPRRPAGLRSASVARIVDGDTLVLRSPGARDARVRLIGIDTPELHTSDKLRRDARRSGRDAAAIQALGAQASAFTRKHLAGRQVQIELDATATDRYGRTLAYVWLGDELYNLAIVREGYAGLLTIPPNVKYADVLAACHRESREQRRGLWADGDLAAGTSSSPR